MPSERRPVVVVGAGLAGLAAAWRLARVGISTTLLEREQRAGGRATSESVEGFELDPGVHGVTSADRNLLALASAAGEADSLLPLRPVARAQLHRGRLVVVNPTGLLGVASLPGVGPRHILRLVRFARLLRRFGGQLDPAAPEQAGHLDDRSVAEFGRLYLGTKLLERWIEPSLADAGIEDDGETSRVAFLLEQVAKHWATPGTLRAPLTRLTGALERGLPVRVTSEVERIEPLGGGGFAVRVRESGRVRALEADAVVLAVPADEAARLAEPALTRFESECLRSVRYSVVLTCAIALGRACVPRVTRVRVPRSEGGIFSALQLEPAGAAGRAPEGRALASLAAREGWSRSRLEVPVETVAKEFVSEFERLFPGIAGSILFTRVHRFPQALPRFEVGRYRALAQLRRVLGERRREGRRLYLAGDFLVAPSLEGAVVSGLRAADAVCEDLRWRRR
jgi:oxygen-dependent protoporphyrinogen oxidase